MLGNTIGVDVGSTSVRAVQVASGRGGPKIAKAAEVPLPRGTVINGEVRDVEALAEAIEVLWRVGKFSSRRAIVGIAGPQQTLVRQIDLPWEPEGVFRRALPLRVSQDLPVDPGEMTLDYYPVQELDRGGAITQRALVVASMNSSVENTVDAMAAARLKVPRADFSPFALIRAAAYVAGEGPVVQVPEEENEERSCEVVIDVGAQITLVAIHDHGRPLFVRLVNGGSESVTRALADHLQLRMEVADELKKSLGISGVDTTTQAGAEIRSQIPPEAIPVAQQVVNLMAGSLVQVARESVEYFLASDPNVNTVSRILLSGGGSLLPGYADRLSSELRAPVQFLGPVTLFGSGRVQSNVEDPRMTIAFGLAMEVR